MVTVNVDLGDIQHTQCFTTNTHHAIQHYITAHHITPTLSLLLLWHINKTRRKKKALKMKLKRICQKTNVQNGRKWGKTCIRNLSHCIPLISFTETEKSTQGPVERLLNACINSSLAWHDGHINLQATRPMNHKRNPCTSQQIPRSFCAVISGFLPAPQKGLPIHALKFILKQSKPKTWHLMNFNGKYSRVFIQLCFCPKCIYDCMTSSSFTFITVTSWNASKHHIHEYLFQSLTLK